MKAETAEKTGNLEGFFAGERPGRRGRIPASLKWHSKSLAAQSSVPMVSGMAVSSTRQVTQLQQAWRQGEESALKQLTPLVHGELRRLAHRYMGAERAAHTLQTTALVNEAYVRLVDGKQVNWQNRAHFFAVSARLMRCIRWTGLALARGKSGVASRNRARPPGTMIPRDVEVCRCAFCGQRTEILRRGSQGTLCSDRLRPGNTGKRQRSWSCPGLGSRGSRLVAYDTRWLAL